MIDRQKWLLAAIEELFRRQKENCAFYSDEIELAVELAELEKKFEKTIDQLAIASANHKTFNG